MSTCYPNPEIRAAMEWVKENDWTLTKDCIEYLKKPECADVIEFEMERAFALGYFMGCKKHNDEQTLFLSIFAKGR